MARMATKVSICSQCQLHVYTIFLVSLVVNSPPANVSVREAGSIPGSGRSPGGGHDNPLQYSCLENPMDRGVWWATFHSVHTPLECLSMHAPYFYFSDILERTEQKEMDFVRSSLDIWETFASHSWACVLYCLFHIFLLRSFSWQEGHPLTSNPTYLLARIQSKCLSVNPTTQAFLVISLFPTQ